MSTPENGGEIPLGPGEEATPLSRRGLPYVENLYVSPGALQVLEMSNSFLAEEKDSERYQEHNKRIIGEMIKEGFDQSGSIMAVALHDFVAHGIRSENSETRMKARAQFKELFDDAEEEVQREMLYGLGVAFSADNWEHLGENWRSKLLGEIEEPGGRFADVKSTVKLAIRGNVKDTKDNREDLFEKEIRDLNIENLLEGVTNFDIEGLVLKAHEIKDNILNPAPNNLASKFRDCVEALNTFCPALELIGYDKLAAELEGIALEPFYAGNIEAATEQRKISENYFEESSKLVRSVTEKLLGDSQGNVTSRVKSIGSTARKLSYKRYRENALKFTPDAIGHKILAPDFYSEERMDELADEIVSEILASDENIAHTDIRSEAKEKENFYANGEKPDFNAINLTFVKNREDGTQVPFEVQLTRFSDDENHLYDRASRIIFKKAHSEITDEEKDAVVHNLRYFRLRAQHLKEFPNAQELNVNTWRYIGEEIPEIETPFSKLFAPMSINGNSVMLPRELYDLIADTYQLDNEKSDSIGTTYLPPVRIDRENFLEILSYINLESSRDPKIRRALDMIGMDYEGVKRRDGETPFVEGHQHCVALFHILMEHATGEIWDHDRPQEAISSKVISALLHDSVEDAEGAKIGKLNRIREISGERIRDIARTALSKEIDNSGRLKNLGVVYPVLALTSPSFVKYAKARRSLHAYSAAKKKGTIKLKAADRFVNIFSDVIRANKEKAENGYVSVQTRREINSYNAKNREHFEESFQTLPDKYRMVYQLIKRFSEDSGFEQA